ncbi:alpha/beta fold hydrolase [Paenibacillus sp. HWE-109]|uniref:alpha/beta fold hydrolase n=1 Tax=Paenibacillus sp. HWE-109 TaxID=1306526 RepID=UPI003080A845
MVHFNQLLNYIGYLVMCQLCNHLPKFGIRCILPDFRGCDKSTRPWSGYPYDRMADDIRVRIRSEMRTFYFYFVVI